MGENRNRIIWLENDVSDIKGKVDELYEQLTAALQNLSEDTAFRRDILGRIQTLQTIVDKHLASTAFLQGATAQDWLSEMHRVCGQVKDSVQSIHAWQNQMSKDFSVALERLGELEKRTKNRDILQGDRLSQMDRDLQKALFQTHKVEEAYKAHEASRLKLAGLADDRIRDLERQLEEATENSRAVVARMEQLETRLRKMEYAPRLHFGAITVTREDVDW